jgi:hypothetical protein
MARVLLALIVAAPCSLLANTAWAQPQVVDPDYDTTVARPAYTAQHPAVLFDEAHHNFHKAEGLYKPFVSLISNDGYRVAINRKPFSKDVLGPHQILVIANAQGAPGTGPDAANAAFSAAECQAVDAWIREGGSLLLITDHHPWGAAAQPLAKRLGVGMSQGQTLDPDNAFPRRPSQLIFARENDLLGDHPIIWGRGPVEQLNRVMIYSGQSLVGPRGSVAFLRLADTAMDRSSVDNAMVSAAGRCQGLALIHGKGRVVVLGDAGALSAQFMQGDIPFGMNAEGTDNRQLSLNVMHWLSGLIPVDRRATARKSGAARRSSSSKKAKSGASQQEKAQDSPPKPE